MAHPTVDKCLAGCTNEIQGFGFAEGRQSVGIGRASVYRVMKAGY